jgi:hypothetical protein
LYDHESMNKPFKGEVFSGRPIACDEIVELDKNYT